MTPRAALSRLERLRLEFGAGPAAEKRALLLALARARLARPREVLRLHEALCFLRAYPDDPALLALVERMLARFHLRPDLRRFRARLADTGIAGTTIRYPFFSATAQWLARRWPAKLAIDWPTFARAEELEDLLPVLAHFAESPGLEEYDYGPRGWVRLLKGPGTSDAAFVIGRLAALRADPFLREKLHDRLDLPVVVAPGPDAPSRTRAKALGARVRWQTGPLERGRPDLAHEARRAPLSVRALSPALGRRFIDLALEAMVTRSRDLDVFTYGDPRDVRLVDFGEGLQFACIGAAPERRLLLEAVYGYLTLRNGVPTGYVLTSALFGSAEIAYNVFETFRDAEAAPVYARVLAMTRHLFGADAFTVYPYQLGGAGNEEGLASGAWWFYQKLGFLPRDPGARALMRRELARLRRRPAHRSSRATLARLAEHNVYFHLGARRADVLGLLPLARAGLAVTRLLARRFGAERERGALACEREAVQRLGRGPERGWAADERTAFARWAPLVVALPGIERWSAAEKGALLAVIRAKGGRRESDFVRAFDAHAKLRQAVRGLVTTTRE